MTRQRIIIFAAVWTVACAAVSITLLRYASNMAGADRQPIVHYMDELGRDCVTVKGQKGRNGGGDGGDATACGDGSIALAGKSGDGSTESPVIAWGGEWVTDPDTNAQVCRLAQPIYRGMSFTRNLCTDWQVPQPLLAQTVPWLRFQLPGGTQIHTAKGWRP